MGLIRVLDCSYLPLRIADRFARLWRNEYCRRRRRQRNSQKLHVFRGKRLDIYVSIYLRANDYCALLSECRGFEDQPISSAVQRQYHPIVSRILWARRYFVKEKEDVIQIWLP